MKEKRKLKGYIATARKLRALLRRMGIRPSHPDYERCRRIARAYFSFDATGDVALRDMIFGQVLRECADRVKDNESRDAGELRQKLNRMRAKLDPEQRPWLAYFTERAIATGSQLNAADDTKKKFKLTESVNAIRMQARRAELIAPRKHRKRAKKK